MKQVNSILDLLGGQDASPLKKNKATDPAFKHTLQQHWQVATSSLKKAPLGRLAEDLHGANRQPSKAVSPLKPKQETKHVSPLAPDKKQPLESAHKPAEPEAKEKMLAPADKVEKPAPTEAEPTESTEATVPTEATLVAWLPMQDLLAQLQVNAVSPAVVDEVPAEVPVNTEANALTTIPVVDVEAALPATAVLNDEIPAEELNKVLAQLEAAASQSTSANADIPEDNPVMSMLLTNLKQALAQQSTTGTPAGVQVPTTLTDAAHAPLNMPIPAVEPQVLLKFAKELLAGESTGVATGGSSGATGHQLFQTLLNEAVTSQYDQTGQQEQQSSQFQHQQATPQSAQAVTATAQGPEQAGKFSLLAEGHLDKINVIQQLVDKMRLMHHNGQREMQVLLKPYDLGTVHMRLLEKDGGFNLHLVAENKATHELLESTIGQLKQNFEAQGIRLEQVLIQLDPRQAQSGGEPKDNFSQRAKEQANSKRVAKVSGELDDEWSEQTQLTSVQQQMLKSYMVNYLV